MNITDMMFDREPIEEFEQLFINNKDEHDWEELLHMCYIERRYLSVGGDEGYLENPPIDEEGIAYLKSLIAFLEANNIKADKWF